MRVAGFGFRKGTGVDSLQAALSLAGGQVDALATLDIKSEGLKTLAKSLNLPIIPVTKGTLAAHSRPGSQRVRDLYGTGSVAESAALAAAGPNAILTTPRLKSPDGKAVVAIAEGQT